MPRIRLFHWNAGEAKERVEALREAGYQVDYEEKIGPDLLRRLREKPPAAVVIDLTRLPSHGRETGVAVRHSKATRRVPLVFVEGEPEKVGRIQEVLPDAVYTSWARIRGALQQAIAHPPENPRVPSSVLEAYSGTPLPKKLGIKANLVVALVGAPEGFEQILGPLPEGVEFRERVRKAGLTLWFIRSLRELDRGMERMAAAVGNEPLWIIWPKKASGVETDLGQQPVREAGLAAGLVDYKVCSVDATWSGLLFRRRKVRSATALRGTSSTRRKQTG